MSDIIPPRTGCGLVGCRVNLDDVTRYRNYNIRLYYPLCQAGHTQTGWHFVTNHTQVLLCIAANPDIRLRDIAERVGTRSARPSGSLPTWSWRATSCASGRGAENEYAINREQEMRHPAQFGLKIGPLLNLLRMTPVTTWSTRVTQRPDRQVRSTRVRRREDDGRHLDYGRIDSTRSDASTTVATTRSDRH